MNALFWVVGSVYVIGFAFVLFMEATAGPVMFGLAMARALVWPFYLLTGIPNGRRLPID